MHEYQKLFETLESNLSKLLPILHNYISNEYENELKKYLSYGEYGVVYEDFCEMIILFGISISQEDFNMISKLGELMEYDKTQWMELKRFIK